MDDTLLRYISQRAPRQFFVSAVENLEAAYHRAFSEAETYEGPERRRIRPQIRHYRLNAAVRTAADATGLATSAPDTNPKGERYTVVTTEGLLISRISVNFDNKIPRPSKHRRAIAALNAHLEPSTGDLFMQSAQEPSDGLGLLLVTINPAPRNDQSTPADVFVGVPYTTLADWHLFAPVSQLLAMYEPEVKPQEIEDIAWAKLKTQLRQAEG